MPLALGVSADAAALAGMVGCFYAIFQHLDVRTPRWLGFAIQRPEAQASARVGAMLIGRDVVDPVNADQRPTTAATAAT